MRNVGAAGALGGRKAWAVAAAVAVAAVLLLYGIVSSDLQGEPSAIPDSVASANNDFAIDFYRQVSDNDGNMFFSPAGMYVAFSALYEGARGNTANQMLGVFGFEPDAEARHNATARTMSSLNRQDPHAELSMANSMWLHRLVPLPSYVDIVRGTYLADIEEFDSPEDGARMINAWASDRTHGRITDLLKPKDLPKKDAAGMVLTNAIYFKGMWATRFPAEDTRESDFWKDSTQSVKTDFMNVQGTFNYTAQDGVQVIEMPYKGDRLSMLVMLPSERDSISELEEAMSAETILKWQAAMTEREVIVSMPKFEMALTYNLTKSLLALGMTDAFDRHLADLSGISSDLMLFVKNSIQKTYVNVNEEGTEAAAVTAVVVEFTSGPPPPPKFVADHPFIFLIQDDESGTILFMGKMADPAA